MEELMNGQSLSKPFCDKRVLYVVLNWKIQDIWPVLKKRFRCIYPELWLAVLIEIGVILMLYQGWNLKDIILFGFGQGSIF